MGLRKEALVSISFRLIKQFYMGRGTAILAYLHPQVLWSNLLPGKYCFGKAAVQECLSREPAHSMYLSGERFETTFEMAGVYRVCGRYSVYEGKENLHPARRERMSFLWVQEEDGWRLLQLCRDLICSDIRMILKLEDIRRKWYFINTEAVLIIEARGSHSLLKRGTDQFEVLKTITELEEQLNQSFLRVHRSYLINPRYVKQLSRFEILMENGDYVPVAEKRYTRIKEYLLSRSKYPEP